MYNFDTVINRKNTSCAKWDKQYQDDDKMICMWVADMDFPTCPDVVEALNHHVSHGIYGYSLVSDSYYQSVIDWMKNRHQFHVEKDWIVPTPGVVCALKNAVSAFTKEGDSVLIMKPVYYPFDFSIETNNRKKIEVPLNYIGGQYELDYALFEQAIIENHVKMFILCNPHNPIGKVWNKEDLNIIGNICKRYGVIVVSDEIHMDFVYKPNKHISFYEVDSSFKDFSIVCTAASKTFNLAALETSNIIIANEKLRELYNKTLDAHGIGAPNMFGLIATETAYQKGSQWVDELVDYIKANIDYMDQFLKTRLPDIKMVKTEGLYLVWVDFRALNMNENELETFMLGKAHLYLDEGYIFGNGGAGFERFNLACPRATLEKALLQLEEAIHSL